MMETGVYSNVAKQAGESRTAGYVPVFGQKKAPSPGASPETFQALVDGATSARNAHNARTAGAKSAQAASQLSAQGAAKGEEGGFLKFLKTVVDIINPLQHIPVVSTFYRQMTGDEISPAARIVGDTLFGGPIGTMIALTNVTVEETTGKDVGGNVMAMLSPDKEKDTQLAAADLNRIAPAGGGNTASAAKDGIIWNDAAPANSPLARMAAADIPVAAEPAVQDVTALVNAPADADAAALLDSLALDSQTQSVIQKFSPPVPPTPVLKSEPAAAVERKATLVPPYKAPVSSQKTVTAHPPLLAATPELLAMQETLTEAGRKPAPSGLIAFNPKDVAIDNNLMPARMMDGLGKYSAMKRSQKF